MKPKYSKRVREEAALICAIAASSGGWGSDEWSYGTISQLLGLTDTDYADCLAWDAWMSLGERYGYSDRARDAEAEALIRTGWSPK